MTKIVDQPDRIFYRRTKLVSIVLLLTWLMVILVSCVISQETGATVVPSPTPQLTLSEDWQFRWLQGNPCRPPCWEGIAPGQVTAGDAVEILRHSPLIANVVKRTDSLIPELGVVTWDWVNGRRGGEANYQTQTASEIIYQIKPRYPGVFRLHDIVQAFGLPSHIIVQAQQGPDIGSRISSEAWIVYLPQGFAIGDGTFGKMDISESASFGNVMFFIPTHEGLAKSTYIANNHPEWVLPWQGFKGFDFYCRDESNGKECRGE